MALELDNILQLPVSIVGRVDLGRLIRELTALDEFLNQAALRDPEAQLSLPRTSQLLEHTALSNKLNLLEEAERRKLLDFMETLRQKAPILHISFAADPSPVFLHKLLEWLRREIHPLVLVQIGLQPSIAAGCVVRTPDKYYDFSLRRHFTDNRGILIERLGAGL